MKHLILRVFLFSILIATPAALAKKQENSPHRIRLLIWWDYLDPRVIQKLKDSNFDLDITVYKSNEVGLSRLVSAKSNFDVAVVSNLVMPALEEAGLLTPIPKVRSSAISAYESFLPTSLAGCVPYLWSSTVFSYDSRKTNMVPRKLADLVKLKEGGFNIAVIDDPYEVAARLLGDAVQPCNGNVDSKNPFSVISNCPNGRFPFGSAGLTESDFRSSVAEIFQGGTASASYGWHGEVAGVIAKYPWLKFEPAEMYPIIGLDSVCMLQKSHEKASEFAQRVKFIRLLTDKESTHWNVKSTQYFSPYKNDVVGLNVRVKSLRNRIVESIGKTQALVLTPPDPQIHKVLNSWWQELRYGNK